MSNKVTLKINSRQDIINGLEDKIKYEDSAFLYIKRGIYYLIYNDNSEGFDGVKTTLKIDPVEERVVVIRARPLEMKQSFQSGKRERGIYQTGRGEMQIETETRNVNLDVSENHGEIFIDYDIYLKGHKISNNCLEIIFVREGID